MQKIILRGDKTRAAKHLRWAKATLEELKRSAPNKIVQRTFKRQDKTLIIMASRLGGAETIMIKAEGAVVPKVSSLNVDIPTRYTSSGLFNDIWDNDLSGFIVGSPIEPSRTFGGEDIQVDRLGDQGGLLWWARSNAGGTSINLTSIDLYLGFSEPFTQPAVTVVPKVWNTAGTVVASGSPVSFTPDPGTKPKPLPISFGFTKGDRYYFGVVFTAIAGDMRQLRRSSGLLAKTFDGANWVDVPPGLDGSSASLQHPASLSFDDASYNHDVLDYTDYSTVTTNDDAQHLLNIPVAALLTATPYHLLAMHPMQGIEIRPQDSMLRVFFTTKSFNLLDAVIIYEYDQDGILLNQTAFFFPIFGQTVFWDILDVEFQFTANLITFTAHDVGGSPSEIEQGTIAAGFLNAGNIYTVGFLRTTPNGPSGGGPSDTLGINPSPWSQKNGYDSWYGNVINTNQREADGLSIPSLTSSGS